MYSQYAVINEKLEPSNLKVHDKVVIYTTKYIVAGIVEEYKNNTIYLRKVNRKGSKELYDVTSGVVAVLTEDTRSINDIHPLMLNQEVLIHRMNIGFGFITEYNPQLASLTLNTGLPMDELRTTEVNSVSEVNLYKSVTQRDFNTVYIKMQELVSKYPIIVDTGKNYAIEENKETKENADAYIIPALQSTQYLSPELFNSNMGRSIYTAREYLNGNTVLEFNKVNQETKDYKLGVYTIKPMKTSGVSRVLETRTIEFLVDNLAEPDIEDKLVIKFTLKEKGKEGYNVLVSAKKLTPTEYADNSKASKVKYNTVIPKLIIDVKTDNLTINFMEDYKQVDAVLKEVFCLLGITNRHVVQPHDNKSNRRRRGPIVEDLEDKVKYKKEELEQVVNNTGVLAIVGERERNQYVKLSNLKEYLENVRMMTFNKKLNGVEGLENVYTLKQRTKLGKSRKLGKQGIIRTSIVEIGILTDKFTVNKTNVVLLLEIQADRVRVAINDKDGTEAMFKDGTYIYSKINRDLCVDFTYQEGFVMDVGDELILNQVDIVFNTILRLIGIENTHRRV